MFERIEILSGDLETGVWLIGKDNISFSGGFNLSRIVKFSEFESITRKEQIKNDVYIEIELVTGKLANAKLDIKHYSKLYDGFVSARKVVSAANHSINTDDKKQNESDTRSAPNGNDGMPSKNQVNLGWGLFIGLIFIAFILSPSEKSKVNSPPNVTDNERNIQHEREAKAIVQSAGYKCDSVDKVLTGFGITLSCNGYQYVYDIEDVGGNWKVTPQ
jgi:hypothetical protein